MTATHPPTHILRFGTSRFLQAHVDLFVDEALAAPAGYPVRIRGCERGEAIEQARQVTAIAAGYDAARDWLAIRALVATTARVIVSNTGDRGVEPHAQDRPHHLDGDAPPRGFPAKLLVLLHGRWRGGGAPATLYPCELVANNGSVLRDVVANLAEKKRRRLLPVVVLATELELGLPQPRLYAALHMEAA